MNLHSRARTWPGRIGRARSIFAITSRSACTTSAASSMRWPSSAPVLARTRRGHVEATLQAVCRALRALGGQPAVEERLRGPDFAEGRSALVRNAEALLGSAPSGRAVRIMVTAGTP